MNEVNEDIMCQETIKGINEGGILHTLINNDRDRRLKNESR